MNNRQIQSIQTLIDEYYEANEQLATLEKKIAEVKEKLMEKLENSELETITVGEVGAEVKVTIVRPTTLKIDEAGLESALTKPQWKLVTKQVVDKKALEDAVVRGKIDANIVAENSKEVASRPYLRITG